MAFHPSTSTIFIVDAVDEAVYEFSTGTLPIVDPADEVVFEVGELLSTIATRGLHEELVESEGITVDTETGNLLIAGARGGTSSLHIVTTDGIYLGGTDLLDLTGWPNPRGLMLDPETRTLYVAFTSEDRIGAFSMGPIPEPVSVDQ